MNRLFGVDLRALAIFRMAIASLLLIDLWYRGQDLQAFFTDAGILPRQARIGLIELGDRFGREHTWSLHMLSGEAWMQGLLMALATWVAISFLLGYRTRITAVISWILLLSLDGRNPAILDSGDVLLRCMLFWSLFLPLGARYSLDRWLRQAAFGDRLEPLEANRGELSGLADAEHANLESESRYLKGFRDGASAQAACSDPNQPDSDRSRRSTASSPAENGTLSGAIGATDSPVQRRDARPTASGLGPAESSVNHAKSAPAADVRGVTEKSKAHSPPTSARWATIDDYQQVCNVASAGLLLQLAMMYFFSALFKTHPVWISECSAVYYALHCDAFATSWGVFLRQFPRLLQALTLGSYLLELVGPPLAFFPLATGRIRILLVLVFWLFHLGLATTLTLGIFPAICIACWLVYLPSEFWDWLESACRRGKGWLEATNWGPAWYRRMGTLLAEPLRRIARVLPPPPEPWSHRWPYGVRRAGAILTQGCLAALLVYLLAWNIRELDVRAYEKWILPLRYNGLARALGLDQNWSMFSPVPRTEDGWLLMVGTLEDGSEVNLWQPDRPVPWSKPALVSRTFRSQRWLKYLDNLTTNAYVGYRDYFCEWLVRRWNQQQAASNRMRRVTKVELFHAVELTPPPGQPIPEPELKPLYVFYPLYYDDDDDKLSTIKPTE